MDIIWVRYIILRESLPCSWQLWKFLICPWKSLHPLYATTSKFCTLMCHCPELQSRNESLKAWSLSVFSKNYLSAPSFSQASAAILELHHASIATAPSGPRAGPPSKLQADTAPPEPPPRWVTVSASPSSRPAFLLPPAMGPMGAAQEWEWRLKTRGETERRGTRCQCAC
jgi:hypothetical protein